MYIFRFVVLEGGLWFLFGKEGGSGAVFGGFVWGFLADR